MVRITAVLGLILSFGVAATSVTAEKLAKQQFGNQLVVGPRLSTVSAFQTIFVHAVELFH